MKTLTRTYHCSTIHTKHWIKFWREFSSNSTISHSTADREHKDDYGQIKFVSRGCVVVTKSITKWIIQCQAVLTSTDGFSILINSSVYHTKWIWNLSIALSVTHWASIERRMEFHFRWLLLHKMELLRLNRKTLQMLGLCSLADESGFFSKIGQVTIVLAVIASLSFFTANSFLFFWENYPPFEHCILAAAQLVSLLQAGFSFISLLFHARNVCNFFNQIQSVFDQCESIEIESEFYFLCIYSGLQFVRRWKYWDHFDLFTCE